MKLDVRNHLIPRDVIRLLCSDRSLGVDISDGWWRGPDHVPFELLETGVFVTWVAAASQEYSPLAGPELDRQTRKACYGTPGTCRDALVKHSMKIVSDQAGWTALGRFHPGCHTTAWYQCLPRTGRSGARPRGELAALAAHRLDQAETNLDLASEAAVNNATEKLAANRTTIVVAHRLTTAARADRIVMMGHGRSAEVGTHQALLDRGGVYAGLRAVFTGDSELAADD